MVDFFLELAKVGRVIWVFRLRPSCQSIISKSDRAPTSSNPIGKSHFCTRRARWGSWKSYLPCSKRSENIVNRKIRFFYIKAIPRNFSQLQKNIIFFEVQKFSEKIFLGNFSKKSENRKFQISQKSKIFIFLKSEKFIFFRGNFQKFPKFFTFLKNYFF